MAQQTKLGAYHTTVANGKVVYFETTIFAQAEDGQSAVIWHGGFKTSSTTTRINQALSVFGYPFGVWRKKGVMWIKSHITNEERAILEPVTIGREGWIHGGVV